jgi:hypothetical protein
MRDCLAKDISRQQKWGSGIDTLDQRRSGESGWILTCYVRGDLLALGSILVGETKYWVKKVTH